MYHSHFGLRSGLGNRRSLTRYWYAYAGPPPSYNASLGHVASKLRGCYHSALGRGDCASSRLTRPARAGAGGGDGVNAPIDVWR